MELKTEHNYLNNNKLPFCDGCGHSLIAKNTEKALQKLGYHPLDVVLVTDIGCHGIIDSSFNVHTVHGLHGRSIALAAGIAMGLENHKKVIVFIGDGGVTIGMQHLIDSAHNNDNITVVLHNNFLYGMTGGQPSELTPYGFRTPVLLEGAQRQGYDICSLVTAAGANYVRRVYGIGDFSDELTEAFSRKGFSFVEVLEICPSYGLKANPKMKLREVALNAGLEEKLYVDINKPYYQLQKNNLTDNLLSKAYKIKKVYDSSIEKTLSIILSGSAGEGVQAAAELLVKTAMLCGLYATKKGSYPVTVGVGYSAAEVIISKEEIEYTGFSDPDFIIITSQDGFAYAKNLVTKATKNTIIFVDDSLELGKTNASVISLPIRKNIQPRNISLQALRLFLLNINKLPYEAFKNLVLESKLASIPEIQRIFQDQD